MKARTVKIRDGSKAWAAAVTGSEATATYVGTDAIRVDGLVCTRRGGVVQVLTPGRDVFRASMCAGRGWEKRAAKFVIEVVPQVPRRRTP